jgi:hypothetical protein
MRAHCARLLHRLAAWIEPPFAFSPDVAAAIKRHSLRADEIGSPRGLEAGYRWAEEAMARKKPQTVTIYHNVGLPNGESMKIMAAKMLNATSLPPESGK